jgi:hypothetical protein
MVAKYAAALDRWEAEVSQMLDEGMIVVLYVSPCVGAKLG